MGETDSERAWREPHLASLMRVACGDPKAGALLVDLESQAEGAILVDMSYGQEHPVAQINLHLGLAAAEAATLHEAGHWLEGHIKGLPADGNYQGAVLADRLNGTVTRARWEAEADRRGLALLEDSVVRLTLAADPLEVERILLEDLRMYADRNRLSRAT